MYKWCFYIFFFCTPVFADSEKEQNLSKVFENHLRALSGLHGKFDAQVTTEDGFEIDKQKGEFWISIPGKFRFDQKYGDTEGSYTVSNGDEILVYNSQLDERFKYTVDGLIFQAPIISVFFDGKLDSKKFDWSIQKEEGEVLVANITPKQESFGIGLIELRFHKSKITSVQIVSSGDTSTSFQLFELKEGIINKSIFEIR